jgi:purine-binding chemotaxis protein CheW
MAEQRQFCSFILDQLLFGVEVNKVQEVIRYQGMTSVPLAPAVVAGLINLRGQIVTAVDLRRQLGMQARPSDQFPMNAVVRTESGAVSLLVDEIGEVVEVSDSQFEPPPDTLQGAGREFIRGAYKLSGKLLLVLNTERVLETAAARAV